MSKLARTLVLGAMLAAMNLAGMTAAAHAQANDDPAGKDARPPTEGQVGESWRKRPVTSQQQAAADAALRRQLAQEHSYRSSETPTQEPATTQADEPSGLPDWLVPSLAVLAAALAVSGGLAGQAAGFGPATPDPRPPTLVRWGCRCPPGSPIGNSNKHRGLDAHLHPFEHLRQQRSRLFDDVDPKQTEVYGRHGSVMAWHPSQLGCG
jgi:hypothetical protein